jgi:hypothetical protein
MDTRTVLRMATVASLIAYHRAAVWREVEAPAEPQLLVL